MKILTSPSLFASDLLNIEAEVKRTEAAGADMIHFDIMDGIYVPNISIGFELLAAVRSATNLPIDAHMMTVKPEKYIERLANAGADIITVHNDIADEASILEMIEEIHNFGLMAAVALKPRVPAEAILPFIEHIDMVLVMTVEPGFSGQSFMDMSDKIRKVKSYIGTNPVSIQVDGGINEKTAAICAEAGANVFVVGSAAYKAPSMRDALSAVKTAAARAYPL
ncbi:MAG: ribulose-phosphate 3-epimerase [Ruminococcaceae bacterium]|nr:ribulose-phosphate 3-epimerase [Oscillospiraceae bacterium]